MKIPKDFLRKIASGKILNPRLSKRFEKILESRIEVATQGVYFKSNEQTVEYIKEYLNYKAKHENIFSRIWKAIIGSRVATANEFVFFLRGCSNEYYNVQDEEDRKKASIRKQRVKKNNRGW